MTALKIADLQRDAYTEGREEGISVGMERGAYEKALETAKKLIARGDSPEDVAELLGVPLETILHLRRN